MDRLESAVLRSAAWGVFARRVLVPWTISLRPLPETADVLEIGCGAGYTTESLARRRPGWRITAIDHDPEMVTLAERQFTAFSERVAVLRGDATSLKFPDGAFDLAVSILVWHHVGAWETATAEAARVLRPGGYLLLMDLLGSAFRGPSAKLFPPARTYRLGELRQVLAESGFDRWRVRRFDGLLYRCVSRTEGGARDRLRRRPQSRSPR